MLRKILLSIVLLFTVFSLSNAQNIKKEFEVVAGTGIGIGGIIDITTNITYAVPVSNTLKLGGGIGYDLYGAMGGLTGSGAPQALSFFADLRSEKPRSNKRSMVLVLDGGAFMELADKNRLWGVTITPQVGWSFKFSENGKTAFDARICFRQLICADYLGTLGILLGFSF